MTTTRSALAKIIIDAASALMKGHNIKARKLLEDAIREIEPWLTITTTKPPKRDTPAL
jgi:hypothetical protein